MTWGSPHRLLRRHHRVDVPERSRGTTTNAADVYAWGALMAYAASGRPLYDDATPLQMMMIVANGPPARRLRRDRPAPARRRRCGPGPVAGVPPLGPAVARHVAACRPGVWRDPRRRSLRRHRRAAGPVPVAFAAADRSARSLGRPPVAVPLGRSVRADAARPADQAAEPGQDQRGTRGRNVLALAAVISFVANSKTVSTLEARAVAHPRLLTCTIAGIALVTLAGVAAVLRRKRGRR